MNDVLANYYEKAFESAGEGGSHYMPMSVLENAGHCRKGDILEAMDIPGLKDAIVVDYGVGSWGFGCVFPKLKNGKVAIGIDISDYAVKASKKISEEDSDLKGKKTEFFTSSGYDIKMPDESADVVFAGECIEHIEDTFAFLSEISRILKPGGRAIFTTPNQKPYVYRQLGLNWAMGFEHVALMDSHLLLSELEQFFEIEETKGYMSSIHPDVDPIIQDAAFAAEYAKLCEDDFHEATGLIVKVRKSPKDVRNYVKVSHKIVESDQVTCLPESEDLSLYEQAMGRMPVGIDGEICVPVPNGAVRCQLVMWSHPWSGIVKIETATSSREIDLFSHVSGCERISLDAKELGSLAEVIIKPTGRKSDLSEGTQAIFFRAVFSIK
ncbi:MAG: class I SAM-dependent methyltransferase [Hyphomonas sp.]|jgi:ubiquinone/menaquinone biosynthesis C-methylase UbiE